jgi:curved DNA-binding protein CbpA
MDRRHNPETSDGSFEEHLQKAFRVIFQSYRGVPPERLFSEAIRCFDALIGISHNTDAVRDFADRQGMGHKYLVDGANFIISKMHFNPENNYYTTLGLPQNVSQNELRERWKSLMLLYHPDRHMEGEEWVSERAKKVNEAYSTLKDDSKRREYDRKMFKQVHHTKSSRPQVKPGRTSRKPVLSFATNPAWIRTKKYLPMMLISLYTIAALIFIGSLTRQNQSSHLESELLPEKRQTSQTALIPPDKKTSSSSPFSSTSVDSLSSESLIRPERKSPSEKTVITAGDKDLSEKTNNKNQVSASGPPDKVSDKTIKETKQETASNKYTKIKKQPESHKPKPEVETKKLPETTIEAKQPQTTKIKTPPASRLSSTTSDSPSSESLIRPERKSHQKPPSSPVLSASADSLERKSPSEKRVITEGNKDLSEKTNNKNQVSVSGPPDKVSDKTIKEAKQETASNEDTKIKKQPESHKPKPEVETKKLPETTLETKQPLTTKIKTPPASRLSSTSPDSPSSSSLIRPVQKSSPVQNEQKADTLIPEVSSKETRSPSSSVNKALITEEEVKDFMQRYIDTYKRNEFDRFMSFFSRSAVENNRLNYAAIQNVYKETFSNKIIHYKLQDMKIRIAGPGALVSGIYDLNFFLSEENRSVSYSGKIYWKLIKENNSLKIISMNYDN